jgi:hypothetical protein
MIAEVIRVSMPLTELLIIIGVSALFGAYAVYVINRRH